MVLFPMETEGPLSSPRGVCVCVFERQRQRREVSYRVLLAHLVT